MKTRKMARAALAMVVAVVFFAVPVPAFAQSARTVQIQKCLNLQSHEAKVWCLQGDGVTAQTVENLAMVERISAVGDRANRRAAIRNLGGGLYGFDGLDGYFYHTDSSGRPTGTREKIITGGAIGATLGAGVGSLFGRGGTGALLGAGTGAIIGAVAGGKANKKARQETEAREAHLLAQAQAQAEAERRAEEEARQVPLVIRNTTGFVARLYQNDRRVRDLRPGQSFSGPEAEYRAELQVPVRGGYVEIFEGQLCPHKRGWDILDPVKKCPIR